MSAAVLAPMNAAEKERRARCVALGCIACRIWGCGYCGGWVEGHHLLVAGERAGHIFLIPLGLWHHQGNLMPGYSQEEMKRERGPSLKLHAVEFHEVFGTDQELLDATNDLIGEPRVLLPTRRRSRGSAASPKNIFPRGGFR